MYIEIIHDAQGNIVGCWVANTLPEGGSSQPLVTSKDVWPKGIEQCRVNIDTVTAMEIENNCGQMPVINPGTGKPEIRNISYAEHIMQNYRVDMTQEIATTGLIPQGMKMRKLIKK